jgi:hypothetical protein
LALATRPQTLFWHGCLILRQTAGEIARSVIGVPTSIFKIKKGI